MAIYNSGSKCSGGFNAQSPVYGWQLILTAGHCIELQGGSTWQAENASGARSDLGDSLTHDWGPRDWGLIQQTNSNWDDQGIVWTNAHNENPIYNWSTSYVTRYTCFSGAGTAWTECGQVLDLDFDITLCNSSGTECRDQENMTIAGDPMCVTGGDSGGPVFEANTALGLVSGWTTNYPGYSCVTVFEELEEVFAVNQIVLEYSTPSL